VREWLEGALQRLQSSDLAMGVHAASTSGGGRITSVAALIGICVSGVGAGTYCVATALLPDPKPIVRSEAKAKPKRKDADKKKLDRLPAPASQAVVPTATATPAEKPAQSVRPSATPVREPPRAVKPVQNAEFSFETGSNTSASRGTAASSPSSSKTADFETRSGSAHPAGTTGEFQAGAGGEFAP
jgi:hypothetical protein